MNPNSPGAVGFVSLGCPKALVDSEQILTQLRAEGYAITPSYEGADVVVVNTCGFIDDAIAESLQAIEEAQNKNGKVIVTGCLGARKGLVENQFPQLLAVTGPHAKDEVMDAIHRALPHGDADKESLRHNPFTDLLPPGGIKLTPRHYAYLKISEGCNHRCTFCIIPSMRGDLVSRPISEVLTEARDLFEAGVKELLIVSQDTSAYGVDIRYRPDIWQGRAVRSHITDLTRELDALAKEYNAWVRLHYIYPYPHVDDLIPLMANTHPHGGILPYLDIPFQHASPAVLKAMKRPAHTEKVLARIQKWREQCPEITLRSTFIVGFPGESSDDFNTLLDFLDEAQLDRVGAFTYSPVEGAKANALPHPVPDTEKQARLAEFMAVQAEISTARLANRIGKQETVIIDELGESEDGTLAAVARSRADAPEIDGVVHVFGSLDGCQSGDFIDVTITGADEHDLEASASSPCSA